MTLRFAKRDYEEEEEDEDTDGGEEKRGFAPQIKT